jgi:hypothetical protein
LDESGAVYIAFFDGSAYLGGPASEAYYATNASGEWVTEAVPIVVDDFIELACDGAGVCYGVQLNQARNAQLNRSTGSPKPEDKGNR